MIRCARVAIGTWQAPRGLEPYLDFLRPRVNRPAPAPILARDSNRALLCPKRSSRNLMLEAEYVNPRGPDVFNASAQHA